MNYDVEMPPCVEDIARCLDDDKQVHPLQWRPCFEGFEIAMAILRSNAQRSQIPLPLAIGEPEIEVLKKVLPDRPVLVSCDANRKEYNVESAALVTP